MATDRLKSAPSTEEYAARPCPACRSSASQREIVAERAAECQSLESVRQHWYGFYPEKTFFSYNRCRCGMLFAPTYLSESQLRDLYGSMPPNMEEVTGQALERTQAGYFEELRKVSPLEGQFLEIGPDVGLFAQHCISDGSFKKYWMFEPNVAAHAELRQRLVGLDHVISEELLNFSAVPDRVIDVVAMIHVLDHLIDPVPFLESLKQKLRPGAVLFIVTHDESSTLAKILKNRWPAYCLQHPHLFNPRSMQQLLARAGFRLERTTQSVNHFPVKFLVKQVALAFRLPFSELPVAGAFQIPLRLGNFISIARPE